MRSLARLALATVLLVGLGLSALGPAQAQEDEREELSFSSSCLQLQCQFELDELPVEQDNVTEIRWTFGENATTATGNPVQHTFEQPGAYNVSVVLEAEADGNATTFEGQGEVTVSAGEVPWEAVGFGVVALAGSLVLARAT